jgi:hypothetical protein
MSDGVHHAAVAAGPGAGSHVADRALAICRHFDGCPRATPSTQRPKVDHAAIKDAGGRRGRLVASDRADLARRNGLWVERVGVRTVKCRRRHTGKRWRQRRYLRAHGGAAEAAPKKESSGFRARSSHLAPRQDDLPARRTANTRDYIPSTNDRGERHPAGRTSSGGGRGRATGREDGGRGLPRQLPPAQAIPASATGRWSTSFAVAPSRAPHSRLRRGSVPELYSHSHRQGPSDTPRPRFPVEAVLRVAGRGVLAVGANLGARVVCERPAGR